jgi:hypothetical protein
MFLLTDGSVLVHHANGKAWYRLSPDAQGDYETGTWSAAINMANTRQFFASGSVTLTGSVCCKHDSPISVSVCSNPAAIAGACYSSADG